MKSKNLCNTVKSPRLRIGLKDVDEKTFKEGLKEKLANKKRITIMLDNSVIAFYKAKAGDRGYQSLINQELQKSIIYEQNEQSLRKIIREELQAIRT